LNKVNWKPHVFNFFCGKIETRRLQRCLAKPETAYTENKQTVSAGTASWDAKLCTNFL
jgi:hypothetical protein